MAIKYNMEFYTHITIPKTPFTFSYTVQTVLLGSCFAENIGKKLEGNKFKTDLNPFGTLYNPKRFACYFSRNSSQEMIFFSMKGFIIASAITAVFPHLRKRNA